MCVDTHSFTHASAHARTCAFVHACVCACAYMRIRSRMCLRMRDRCASALRQSCRKIMSLYFFKVHRSNKAIFAGEQFLIRASLHTDQDPGRNRASPSSRRVASKLFSHAITNFAISLSRACTASHWNRRDSRIIVRCTF